MTCEVLIPQQTAATREVDVTGDVPQSPDGLLADVLMGGRDQAHEGVDGTAPHHGSGLIRRPGGDVGQSPGRLELDGRVRRHAEEGHELRDEPSADHLIDGGVFVSRQHLPVCGAEQRRVQLNHLPWKTHLEQMFEVFLPCSLGGLELGLRITAAHSCDYLLHRPLPRSLRTGQDSRSTAPDQNN